MEECTCICSRGFLVGHSNKTKQGSRLTGFPKASKGLSRSSECGGHSDILVVRQLVHLHRKAPWLLSSPGLGEEGQRAQAAGSGRYARQRLPAGAAEGRDGGRAAERHGGRL